MANAILDGMDDGFEYHSSSTLQCHPQGFCPDDRDNLLRLVIKVRNSEIMSLIDSIGRWLRSMTRTAFPFGLSFPLNPSNHLNAPLWTRPSTRPSLWLLALFLPPLISQGDDRPSGWPGPCCLFSKEWFAPPPNVVQVPSFIVYPSKCDSFISSTWLTNRLIHSTMKKSHPIKSWRANLVGACSITSFYRIKAIGRPLSSSQECPTRRMKVRIALSVFWDCRNLYWTIFLDNEHNDTFFEVVPSSSFMFQARSSNMPDSRRSPVLTSAAAQRRGNVRVSGELRLKSVTQAG